MYHRSQTDRRASALIGHHELRTREDAAEHLSDRRRLRPSTRSGPPLIVTLDEKRVGHCGSLPKRYERLIPFRLVPIPCTSKAREFEDNVSRQRAVTLEGLGPASANHELPLVSDESCRHLLRVFPVGRLVMYFDSSDQIALCHLFLPGGLAIVAHGTCLHDNGCATPCCDKRYSNPALPSPPPSPPRPSR